MVGIVAFDKLAAAELADVRDVFGRRHAGYLVKFMVEMRMVGVAQSCGNFRNVGSFRGAICHAPDSRHSDRRIVYAQS